MAYDEHLAARIWRILGHDEAVSQRKMFGGLAYLLDGNMVCAASRTGDLLIRVGPGHQAKTQSQPHVRPMVHGQRVMTGFFYVAPEGIATDDALASWIETAVAFVQSLPPKAPKGRR